MASKFKTIYYSLFSIHVFLFLAGCGYTTKSTLPEHIRSISISPIKNATSQPGVNHALSNALSQRFGQDPRFQVVGREGADAVLEGTVIGYSSEGVAFDRSDIASRFRLRIVFRFSFVEKGGNILIGDEQLVGEAFYPGGADIAALKAAEEQASRRAIVDLAEATYQRIREGL